MDRKNEVLTRSSCSKVATDIVLLEAAPCTGDAVQQDFLRLPLKPDLQTVAGMTSIDPLPGGPHRHKLAQEDLLVLHRDCHLVVVNMAVSYCLVEETGREWR